MTFKTRPNTYCIELSPTARARCRCCHRPIALGATRLRITAFVRPNRATRFFRCATAVCLDDHRLAAAVLAACGSPERLPCSAQVPRDGADAVRAAIAAAARREGKIGSASQKACVRTLQACYSPRQPSPPKERESAM